MRRSIFDHFRSAFLRSRTEGNPVFWGQFLLAYWKACSYWWALSFQPPTFEKFQKQIEKKTSEFNTVLLWTMVEFQDAATKFINKIMGLKETKRTRCYYVCSKLYVYIIIYSIFYKFQKKVIWCNYFVFWSTAIF